MMYSAGNFLPVETRFGVVRIHSNTLQRKKCDTELPFCFEVEEKGIVDEHGSFHPFYLNDADAQKLLFEFGVSGFKRNATLQSLKNFVSCSREVVLTLAQPGIQDVTFSLSRCIVDARPDGIIPSSEQMMLLNTMNYFRSTTSDGDDEQWINSVYRDAYGMLSNKKWKEGKGAEEQEAPYQACLVKSMRRLFEIPAPSATGFAETTPVMDVVSGCGEYEHRAAFRESALAVFSRLHAARQYWSLRQQLIALASGLESSPDMLSSETMQRHEEAIAGLLADMTRIKMLEKTLRPKLEEHQQALTFHRRHVHEYERVYFLMLAQAGKLGFDPSSDPEIQKTERIIFQRGYAPSLAWEKQRRNVVSTSPDMTAFDSILRPVVETVRMKVSPEDIANARWLFIRAGSRSMGEAVKLANTPEESPSRVEEALFQAMRYQMFARNTLPLQQMIDAIWSDVRHQVTPPVLFDDPVPVRINNAGPGILPEIP